MIDVAIEDKLVLGDEGCAQWFNCLNIIAKLHSNRVKEPFNNFFLPYRSKPVMKFIKIEETVLQRNFNPNGGKLIKF